ncbi:GGDEF domain-containing protein [Clostridium tyrobutyricum]|nr:GGDEF domain-containing protein [Clostridium tyrobutyricum]MCH4259541.1 diguanylate cyclase [Clostridium tyrobutyricum]MCI1651215.1 diguanylate cyclase [Clostridium tyrobutyricum]MCI1938344.1 diguanylate cyclase [Clostridium tyrobutyricum]MCI1993684.1 diguanylate cyclase [Clostridium tyrobutyricum]MCI2005338.1 diguanylate cyclase [Clostridium tyrobutyricum]
MYLYLELKIANNIIAIIISFIFLFIIKNIFLDEIERRGKLYINMFKINIICLILQTFACVIEGQDFNGIILVSEILDMAIFILQPINGFLWYLFIKSWVDKNRKFINKIFLFLPIIINSVFVITNPYSKFMFNINSQNVYTRGPFIFITLISTCIFLLYSFLFSCKNKYKIDKNEFLIIVLFIISIFLGTVIQLIFKLIVSLSVNSYILIVVYMFYQNKMLQTDSLTGAYNREKLIVKINRIITGNYKQKFCVVFIDLDNFKYINDNWGHNEGDTALIIVVNLIKVVLNKDDFITRYGGDEFVIFLNVENREEIKNIISRILQLFDKYNRKNIKSYKLTFSYGYKLYDSSSPLHFNEYINDVDNLMYKTKQARKSMNL